ncbi:MaoC/PaaZ C-terminal domain-containing protein [Brevundimonas abyssalis]|uniref:MaoC/PaaZ C-terminal domain-containing protein n=1 Tax=Brevundimonas abyssalis TaxID=1125965 RepID=UPI00223B5A32|nr:MULTISPECIES: MaoC/PaaZ C-terminal domain-containing protein [Brevundimonas]
MASPFGTTIAHGFLTLSMIPAMQNQLIAFEGFDRVLNYGLDRLRCPSPVGVDRRIRLTQKVASIEHINATMFRVVLDSAIWIEDEDKPAIIASLIAQLHAAPDTT